MATHSSIPTWRIPWTEKPGGVQSIESQRVRHDWSDLAHTHTLNKANTNRKPHLKTSTSWFFTWWTKPCVFKVRNNISNIPEPLLCSYYTTLPKVMTTILIYNTQGIFVFKHSYNSHSMNPRPTSLPTMNLVYILLSLWDTYLHIIDI